MLEGHEPPEFGTVRSADAMREHMDIPKCLLPDRAIRMAVREDRPVGTWHLAQGERRLPETEHGSAVPGLGEAGQGARMHVIERLVQRPGGRAALSGKAHCLVMEFEVARSHAIDEARQNAAQLSGRQAGADHRAM